MRKRIYLLNIAFALVIFATACTAIVLGAKEDNSKKIDVSIAHIDNSIKSNNGQVIAEIYYDKPLVVSNSVDVQEINLFFEIESQEWLGGTSRLTHFGEGWYDSFLITVDELRESMGDNVLSQQPVLYTVDTKIMMCDDSALSIMQIATIQTTGSRSWYYFGSTFDLKTGELLPIDAFIEIDAGSLKNLVVSFLENGALHIGSSIELDRIKNIYGKHDDHGYEIIFNHEKIQLNYEYFFDGQYFYIILNHGIFSDNGSIMKWNGQYGNEFEASLIGYIVENDKTIREIKY